MIFLNLIPLTDFHFRNKFQEENEKMLSAPCKSRFLAILLLHIPDFQKKWSGNNIADIFIERSSNKFMTHKKFLLPLLLEELIKTDKLPFGDFSIDKAAIVLYNMPKYFCNCNYFHFYGKSKYFVLT